MPTPFKTQFAFLCVCATLLMLCASKAHAQVTCSSDAQPTPTMLLERFVNADCESCWGDKTTRPAPSALVLDWIVPGTQGDEAPLAAAALHDAQSRLADMKQDLPKTLSQTMTNVKGLPGATLRVAHGPAVGGYLGASITLTLPPGAAFDGPLQTWLVMVETLPAGFEGSPVPRNLVRNVLQPHWNLHKPLENSEQLVLNELRPLNIPHGARPERLRVLGWVQDALGKMLVAAESVCEPEDK
jgi:hypothetical protein